ncbi:MAG: dTDP-glucose 4,6-dehydratase [Acidobacteria bacterium]|nr:dTDP-glucose 4,6-dehydratase [Acidobacteriota bacterium]
MKILVTGGAGFIGSNFIRLLLVKYPEHKIINFDKLTYAGNLENLADLANLPNYSFIKGDICDSENVMEAISDVDAIVNFAAESHVDRSIKSATPFVSANVYGTQVLLDCAREKGVSRFIHISTDEVGGSLEPGDYLDENSRLYPSSPYAASKAAAEHFVYAARHTHGLDTVMTRTCNNYGPYQFPEKLIPLMIANALENKPLPVYGDGLQVRDWIYVEDNCEALYQVLINGRSGEIYNIGSRAEKNNLEVIETILKLLDRSKDLITFVADRPGHDRRYGINPSKIEQELGWKPEVSFEQGLKKTIDWYLNNQTWLERTRSGVYREYYQEMYGERALLK